MAESRNAIEEIERRFWVADLPREVTAPTVHRDGYSVISSKVIVQGYLYASAGYGVRIRATVRDRELSRGVRIVTDELLEDLLASADEVSIGVKGPRNNAMRLEWENEFPYGLGRSILQQCSSLVVKNRYGYWFGEFGWDVDVFLGENAPLILAECETERYHPHLTIPSFCRVEITSDRRFDNDRLAFQPYSKWANEFESKLV